MTHLTQDQITTLLYSIQDGTMRITTDDGVPDLVPTLTLVEDVDLSLLPSRPLTPCASLSLDDRGPSDPQGGQDRLLACMLLHLAGAPPDQVRDLVDGPVSLPVLIRHYLARSTP